jgi:hypothetical protein
MKRFVGLAVVGTARQLFSAWAILLWLELQVPAQTLRTSGPIHFGLPDAHTNRTENI